MAIISDSAFINNVKACLSKLHLTDIPMPFAVINNRLYLNATKEQIYGIMSSSGDPLSPEDTGFSGKRFNGVTSDMVVEFYDKVERLKDTIKQNVLSTVGSSPPITPAASASAYTALHDSLFGPSGFFLVPNTPLNAASTAVLSDLFKELLNMSKGVKL